MSGLECDTVDEIEALVSRFECDTLQGRRENKIEDRAERTFEDLLKVRVVNCLKCSLVGVGCSV